MSKAKARASTGRNKGYLSERANVIPSRTTNSAANRTSIVVPNSTKPSHNEPSVESTVPNEESPQLNSESSSGASLPANTEEDDKAEIFAGNLNGIILQYLESCGLSETYATFYDECKSAGMLIPSHFREEIASGINPRDVETLLMHFDQDNGDALLELWDVLTNMVDVSDHSIEIEKITFYMQVYIALIPFRQKKSDEKKKLSMQKLRDYFQAKSEACTMDKEMLSLFALPFVPDPEAHPVFGNLFQAAWIRQLRSLIKSLARALCSPNKLMTRENTDLAKMFAECSKAIPHTVEASNGKKFCVLSNAHPVEFTSGVVITPPVVSRKAKDEFNPSKLFQKMNSLAAENEKLELQKIQSEEKCAQLLNMSLHLVKSLEDATQGKEVNMDKLRYEVNGSLPPEMRKDFKVPKSVSGSDIYSSCYESDESNQKEDDEVTSEKGNSGKG